MVLVKFPVWKDDSEQMTFPGQNVNAFFHFFQKKKLKKGLTF